MKQDETIKEGDLLDKFIEAIKEEFKDHNWDYLSFIADKVRGNNPTLAKENKQLKERIEELMEDRLLLAQRVLNSEERVKLLEGVLQDMVKEAERLSLWDKTGRTYYKAKAAIQNNTIKP